MLPLLGVLTHIVDQNNPKAMKNTGVKNGYVLHLSTLNHPFSSLENLCSRYESPFTALRKKNVLGPLGEGIPGRGAEMWPGWAVLWAGLAAPCNTHTEHISSILHPSGCAGASEQQMFEEGMSKLHKG